MSCNLPIWPPLTCFLSRDASRASFFTLPGCSVRYQEPCSTRAGTRQGGGGGQGQRELVHGTAGGSRTPLTTHPRPEAVSARGSPCPHTRNSLAVRKLITKGTYLTRERQIASWREVDSCFWGKLSSDGQHDAHKQTCGARTCGVHTCAPVTLL